ncbi:MAG: glycosyltransferase family 2 protein [Bacteroidota bacterium]
MNELVDISVVSPVYRSSPLVDELVMRLRSELSKITENFEIILVDDRSPDDSWNKIEENCRNDKRIKGIRLSRNFGQHPAMLSGLNHARGEWVVVMDCDLQDRPEEIPNLFRKATETQADLVLALRNNRQDGIFKKLFSRAFYALLSYLTGTEQDPRIANFGIYKRKVVDAVKQMPEYNRYFPVMVRWTGFRPEKMEVTHGKREKGRSAYNFSRHFHLALQIILSFSEKPLYLTIKLGLAMAFLSFCFGVYIAYRAFTHNVSVEGWASTIVSIWFLGGLIISLIGVMGLYIGKTFEQVRNRPIYIIDEKKNLGA